MRKDFVELEFQHRTKGYGFGGTLLLPSEVANKTILYLKTLNQWYPKEEPEDAVIIVKENFNFLRSINLNLPFEELFSEYEIMLGFIEGSIFINTNLLGGDIFILRGISTINKSQTSTLILPDLMNSFLSYKEISIQDIVVENKRRDGRPILVLEDFEYSIEVCDSCLFEISNSLSMGI